MNKLDVLNLKISSLTEENAQLKADMASMRQAPPAPPKAETPPAPGQHSAMPPHAPANHVFSPQPNYDQYGHHGHCPQCNPAHAPGYALNRYSAMYPPVYPMMAAPTMGMGSMFGLGSLSGFMGGMLLGGLLF